ncbi:MAG: sodium/solute symporter [Prevotellaceae bacterium]|nr:sodium/solute symporter [Prevotellaceae bacterium]
MQHVLRKALCLALLFSLTLATSAKTEVRYETLPPHYLAKGQGVSAAFTGYADGHLIIAGGCNFPYAAAADGGEKRFYDDIWHLSSRGWFTNVNKLPYPMAYGAYVSTGDWLVCIGGTNKGGLSLPDVCQVNERETQKLPSLPVGIDNASATLSGGYIYLAGGETEGKPQQNVYRFAYPGGTDWELIATMPGQARLQPCVAVQTDGANVCLFVFGGYDPSDGRIAESVLKLDLKTLAWKSLPSSEATVGMTAVATGYSHVLFFGGVDKDIFPKAVRGEWGDDYLRHTADWYRFNPDILVYHTITNSWYSIPGKSFLARAGAGLVEVDDAYVLADGESRPGVRSGDVEKVQFSHSTSFGWLNWLVLVLYLVGMLGVGIYFMRRESGSDDFFRGGGRVPWWAAGISIYATMLSAITYMAIPAKAYATNWTYYPMLVTILLVSFPVIRYYLPYFRKLNITSAYEYLELRFNAATRLLASGLFIVFMVARMALVLYLPSLALTAVTGIDIRTCIMLMGAVTIVYCTMGGVEAVIWGDVIQGIILVGGAFFAAFYLFSHTEGGFAGAIRLAVDGDKMRLFEWSLDYRSVTFWVAIIGGLANNLISYTSDQTVIQRYLTTKDLPSARKSILTNGVMCVVISIVFYFIGTGLYTFYKTNPEQLDFTMQKGDAIFPFFMMSQLPAGLAGLLIAAIFAATMSTISSNINSISTAFGIDFVKRFRPSISERALLRVARATCVACGLVGVGIALLMATWDILSLLDYFNTILGLLTSGLGGLFFMGVFLKRIDGRSALVGFIVGTLVVFWMQFRTDASLFLFGAAGMAVSVLTGWLLSLFTSQRQRQ